MNWLHYFQHNRDHRLPVPWEEGVRVPAALRQAFVRSLQRFQLGESGEGRHLRRHASARGDADYLTCIDLFIREEQEHARLMGRILGGLGAPLLKGHWTDVCFVLMRRYLGLKSELLVLLLAEMIAKRYFRALKEGFHDPVLRAVCTQILQDEEGHLTFHTEFLNGAFARLPFWPRLALLAAWRLAFRLTCAVVWWDHGTLLSGLGVPRKGFIADCAGIFDEVAAGIFSPACVLSTAEARLPARA